MSRSQARFAPRVDERPVALLTAMREELAPLLARVDLHERFDTGVCWAHRGELRGAPVVLAHTGEGRTHAAASATALFDCFRPRLAVVLGISGGLSRALVPGRLVVARRVLDEDRPVAAPDTAWVERSLGHGNVVAGTVISTRRILCTAAQKAAAGSILGRDQPAVVDLESAVIAMAAARRGLPYLVLRSVCDTLEEELPLDLERCRDDSGGVRRLAVVGQALLHPSSVRGLWRLRRRLGRGARDLAETVEQLLDPGASS